MTVRAYAMTPANADTLFSQALQHHQAGRWDLAAAGYAQVCRVAPNHPEAHQFGGGVALQLGRIEEAIRLLERSVRLNPKSALAQLWAGGAYAQAGRLGEAETQMRHALRLAPDNPDAWSQLGSVLMLSGKGSDAINAFQNVVKLQPKSAQAWSALGSAQQLQGQSAAAIESQTRALALDPKHPKARSARAQCYVSLHRVDEALSDFDLHLQHHEGDLEAASFRLFALNYLSSISAEALAEEHRAFGRRARAAVPASVRLHTASNVSGGPDKRLRLAFLSPDLRTHSVAHFLEPLLEQLDRGAFEIVLYHDHFSEDLVTARLKGHASLYRNFVGQSHDRVERQIREDAPDILIDLAGHTGFNRMPLYARRLSPVQVNYLGYPNTTGLTEMDFRFTDPVADPLGSADALHTEKLVRFSSTAWVYSPPRDAPSASKPPSASGVPFTFGSFNMASKLNDRTLSLWAGVLQAVPGSRLLLKTFGLDETRMRARAASLGIAPERVVVLPSAPSIAEHLALYAQVDVALDPFPYHGTTTTCEALWMGVPVVSLQGDRHAARVGGSLLQAIGHPEWSVATSEDYIAVAAGLAAAPQSLSDLRRQLRTKVAASPLLDHAGQAARFGNALRQCWQQTCARRLDALFA